MVDEKSLNIFVWKYEMQEISLVYINFDVEISHVSCRHFDEVSACEIGRDFLNKPRDYKLSSIVFFHDISGSLFQLNILQPVSLQFSATL